MVNASSGTPFGGAVIRKASVALAILSASVYIVADIVLLSQVSLRRIDVAMAVTVWLPVIVIGIAAIALLLGALGDSKRAPRRIIAGCILILVVTLVGFIGAAIYRANFSPAPGVLYDAPIVPEATVWSALIFIVPAVITLIVTLLSSRSVNSGVPGPSGAKPTPRGGL